MLMELSPTSSNMKSTLIPLAEREQKWERASLEVIAAGELGIPMIPPFATQQFTEGHYVGPHPLQMQQQLSFTLEVINPPQQLVAPLIAQQPWLDTPGLGTTQPMVLQAVHCNGLGGNGRAVQLQAMQPAQ